MRPLTRDDLLPLAEYAARRAEFADSHRQYCERYRRVHIGAHVTLTFQNRQTLWFRVQEMLRVMCLVDESLVQRELEICNRLLPRRNHLVSGLSHAGLACLLLEQRRVPGQLAASTPEDQALGVASWVDFSLADSDSVRFIDPDVSAAIEFEGDGAQLPDELRQSLIDDLMMSDREAA